MIEKATPTEAVATAVRDCRIHEPPATSPASASTIFTAASREPRPEAEARRSWLPGRHCSSEAKRSARSQRNSPAGWTRRRQDWSAHMVSVAGHITVEPQQRESDLAGCVRIVELLARQLAASTSRSARDLVDPSRVDIFECWESQAGPVTFRSSGPDTEPPGDAHGVRSGVRHRRRAARCSGRVQLATPEPRSSQGIAPR